MANAERRRRIRKRDGITKDRVPLKETSVLPEQREGNLALAPHILVFQRTYYVDKPPSSEKPKKNFQKNK